MSLFVCDKCGCVENTALGDYWPMVVTKQPVLCSECSPNIGRWHGKFKKMSVEEYRNIHPETKFRNYEKSI